MKTKEVKTIVNNEEYVRLRIYDGEFTPDEAFQKWLEFEKAQHIAFRKWANECIDNLTKEVTHLRYIPWYTRLIEQTKDLIRSFRPNNVTRSN